MAIAEQTEREIDATRSEYVPVAVNTQIMFFCVSDLTNIDPMYQYSLEWFTRIFLNSITNAAKAGQFHLLANAIENVSFSSRLFIFSYQENLKDRIVNINDHFTFNLFSNVCRSLFEKHKLLFAFILTVRVLMNQQKIKMVRTECRL